MGITTKSKTSSNITEKWGMGLLLVFFNEEPDTNLNRSRKISSSSSTTNLIITKAQSTISICALLVFVTLLLFTLSTFEPTIPHQFIPPRRVLLKSYPQNLNKNPEKPINQIHDPHNFSKWVSEIWADKLLHRPKKSVNFKQDLHALQGMGKLFLRGTKAMSDLIVVHVIENAENRDEFVDRIRVFLRVLHRSGLTSRADTVFIFHSKTEPSVFNEVIETENDSFLQLVRRYQKFNNISGESKEPAVKGFDVTLFLKKEKDTGESIWGKKNRGMNNSVVETETTRYGSVVGFDSNELDPENSLSGFFDQVPFSLRRWSCYPMLLGRIRRNYKHIVLLDMKRVLLLSDPLVRVRTQSPESVFLFTNPLTSNKHPRKSLDKPRQVNSAVIMGGSRGVRRFSNIMLTEIVRAAMQHKGKHLLTESGILNQLVQNEFLLKEQVNLIISSESIPNTSSLTEWTQNSGSKLTMVLRDNNGNRFNGGDSDINFVIKKHICSFEVDSSVYRDCEELNTSKKVMKL